MLRSTALAALLLLAPALPAAAAPIFADRNACLKRAEDLPDFAFEEAKLWEKQGGGAEARLCQALSLLLRGDWALAAPALEAAATELGAEPLAARADLWSRAALAWQNADQPDKAEAAYAKALALKPDDQQILTDRAIARAAVERYWDAIADLDKVIAKAPKQAEAWLLRAHAYRVLALNSKAMDDVDQALTLAPTNAEALLLRGNLLADADRLEEAKAEWERVRRVAPNSTAAADAVDNLNALTRAQEQQAAADKDPQKKR